MSGLESVLLADIAAAGLPTPEREYRFHNERLWRFDFAYPLQFLAIEVEGGTWQKSRHTSGEGFQKDCEKYNTAALMGWTVLRFTTTMINSGEAIKTIREALT